MVAMLLEVISTQTLEANIDSHLVFDKIWNASVILMTHVQLY